VPLEFLRVEALASALIGSNVGRAQLAIAATLLRMNADSAEQVAKLIQSAQQNFDRLANVAAGIGQNLDLSI
jgi:hypothetical protein